MINRTQDEIIQNWKGYDVSIPLVSIRCITYNHEQYISQALDGFLMQKTTFPFEIVVHDDASTDNTAEIIREYEKQFPKIIKPIYETENQYSKHDGTIARIMNAAMKGKYIAYCEGDDYWIDENKLQLQFEALENNQECVISVCKVKTVTKNNVDRHKYIPSSFLQSDQSYVTLADYCINEFKKGIYTFQTSSFFIRRNIYNEYINNRPECFTKFPFGDMPLVLYCLTKGNCYFINQVMSSYRFLSGGFMSTMNKEPQKRIKVDEKLIDGLKRFNEYTEYKYEEYVNGRISRSMVNIALLQNDKKKYRQIKKTASYKGLCLKVKMYYWVKFNCSFVYEIYGKFRKI